MGSIQPVFYLHTFSILSPSLSIQKDNYVNTEPWNMSRQLYVYFFYLLIEYRLKTNCRCGKQFSLTNKSFCPFGIMIDYFTSR